MMLGHVEALIQQSAQLYIPAKGIQQVSNWAMSWENLLMPCANSKDVDHPEHPRSLINIFVIRFLDSIISIDAIS